MTSATLHDVQRGWKVFAGDQEIGAVTEIGTDSLTVAKGTLMRHEYRIPADLIAEAAEGVVDLSVERDVIEALPTRN
jgi:hypothetical protein